MPAALALPLVAAFGLADGSFLNVCIHRLPRGQSIAWPPSRWPSCGRAIRWHHNVPVFGYLALGGRCFDCGGRISAAYPVVEAVTAAVFVLHYQQYGWSAILVVRLAFAAAMIALFTIDLEHQILPNLITVPGIAAGLAASLLVEPGWRSALIGALVGGGLLWLVSEAYFRIRGVEGLGFGDVKMLAMIGAFLGWKLTIVTLCGASLAGAVLGLVLIASGRGTLQLKLPFGSFLGIAALGIALLNNYVTHSIHRHAVQISAQLPLPSPEYWRFAQRVGQVVLFHTRGAAETMQLKATVRAEYVAINDDEAMAAFHDLCRLEGIIPALESSHAIAHAKKLAPTMKKDQIILVNLSGRGDKDINTVAKVSGITL